MGVFRRLSELLKVDVKYIVKNGLWLGFGYGSVGFFRLLLVVILARFADKQFFGEFQFVSNAVAFAMLFSLPGMDTSVVQSVARGFSSSFVFGVREKLKWGLAGSLLLIGMAAFFKFVRFEGFWPVFIGAAFLFPLYAGYTGVLAYFRGKEEFHRAALYDCLIAFVVFVVVLTAFLVSKSLLVMFLSSLLSVIIVFWIVYSRIDVNEKPVDKNMVSFGRHLTFMNSLNYVVPYVDKLVVGLFAGFDVLAVYYVATAFTPYVSATGRLFTVLLLPKLSRRLPDHSRCIKRLFWWFVLAVACFVGILALIIPWLVPFVFSEKYVDAVFYAQFSLIYLAFFLPSTVIYAFFLGRRKTNVLYVYNLGIGVLNLLLLGLFVYLFGVFGAVLAKVVLGIVGFAFLVVFFYRNH